MRKIVRFFVLTTFAIATTLGIYASIIVSSAKNNIFDVALNELESLADIELPEVVIECGEVTGRCWDGDCEPFYTPFGFNMAWDCYEFTGSPFDTCVDGAPCLLI